MKRRNKKILSMVLFIVVLLGCIGIANSYASLIKEVDNTKAITKASQVVSLNSNAPNVHITIDKLEHQYVVGDKIAITPKVDITGGDFNPNGEGEHPDCIDYTWYIITGKRPFPFAVVEGQDTETLTFEKAALNNSGIYHLRVNLKRWNEETKTYDTIKDAYSTNINITVYPELHLDLEGDKESSIPLNKADEGNNYTLELYQQDTYKIHADLYRMYDEKRAEGAKVTWKSSKPDIVSVTMDGYLTALNLSEEPVTITATVTDVNGTVKTATVKVTVKEVEVTSIEIEPKSVELQVGDEKTLTATVSPENALNSTITWELTGDSNSIVDMRQEGQDGKSVVITAKAIGSATVTAKAGDKSASCTIMVVKTPVTSIVDDVTDPNISLYENADGSTEEKHTVTIHAKVLPENATNQGLTWKSSNSDIATVTPMGDGSAKITAGKYVEGANTCTITVTSDDNNEVTKTYYITVLDHYIPLEKENGIALVPAGPVELTIGEGQDFNFTINPENATYKNVTWSVTNEGVIHVNNAGYVTAVGVGTAKVQVKVKCQNPECPEHTATATVKVNPIVVTTIEIEQGDNISLRKNEVTTLTAKVSPENATDKTVTWTSSDESIATVEKTTGVVKAMKPGTVTITATSSNPNVTDTCTIEVTPIQVEYLTLSESQIKLKDNESAKLTVGYYPENADNKAVVWTSSDPTVATVAEDGTILAKKPGKTTITVAVKDDATVPTVTCEVTVVPSTAQVVIYTVDQHGNFIPGMTLKLVKIGENDEEFVVKEISSDGKYDFGNLTDGKYAVYVTGTPETDFFGNSLDIIDYPEFYSFEIVDGEMIYTNLEVYEITDSLVLVNIVDYSNEKGEDKLTAGVGVGEDYTKNNQTIEEQYQAFIQTKPQPVVPEDPETPQTPVTPEDSPASNDEGGLPQTSDIPVGMFAVMMGISFVGITFILHKKKNQKA